MLNDAKAPLQERKNFSERLRASLLKRNLSTSPSVVARGFNFRSETSPVTPHAVRKWLIGDAIPTQERILVLAKWLNVTASWLRFGDVQDGHFLHDGAMRVVLSDAEQALVSEVLALSKPSQAVIADLVNSLKKLETAARGERSANSTELSHH